MAVVVGCFVVVVVVVLVFTSFVPTPTLPPRQDFAMNPGTI